MMKHESQWNIDFLRFIAVMEQMNQPTIYAQRLQTPNGDT